MVIIKILIGQPLHEIFTEQLESEILLNKNVDAVLYPEGYLSNSHALESACRIAKENKVMIITSYKKESKNRAIIINACGEKILERAKTSPDENEELLEPLAINYNGHTIGYLLCMEILKGVRDLKKISINIDFIAHPIGVGMYSEEQFEEWINEAINIAKIYKTNIMGTSHADGSFRDCGISIPISYCIGSNGEPIFISKGDTRTRIVDLSTYEVENAKCI